MAYLKERVFHTNLSTEIVRKWISLAAYSRCVKIRHAYVLPRKSRIWPAVRGLAHIVFHNLCANFSNSGGHSGLPCINRAVPKNAAADICPLNSNTLILIKALAHNLFHKICEEAWGCAQDVYAAWQGWALEQAGPSIDRSRFSSGMGLYQPGFVIAACISWTERKELA